MVARNAGLLNLLERCQPNGVNWETIAKDFNAARADGKPMREPGALRTKYVPARQAVVASLAIIMIMRSISLYHHDNEEYISIIMIMRSISLYHHDNEEYISLSS